MMNIILHDRYHTTLRFLASLMICLSLSAILAVLRVPDAFAAQPSRTRTEAAASGPSSVSVRTTEASSASVRRTGSGWMNIGGRISYVYSSGRKAVGFLKTGGRWYHFDASGQLSTGWFQVGSARYYAGITGRTGKKYGALKTGYQKVNGVYYSFAATGRAGSVGKLQTGWISAAGCRFYYTEDGRKASGLMKVGNRIFYFSQDGTLKKRGRSVTGWKTINGRKYYFRKSGGIGVYGAAYQSTTVKIKKKRYTFDADGALVSSADKQKETSAGSGSAKNNAFVEEIGVLAHADMERTGVLASVTAAQAIVESNYGKSLLASKAKNLFGMKASLSGNDWGSVWNGKVYKKKTLEYKNGKYVTIKAKFRRYSSWSQSIADHSAYLSGARKTRGALRYAGIVGERDYKKAATIIKKGGYATAPNYVSALCSVIERYDLTRFD